jgi:hypothetical protein
MQHGLAYFISNIWPNAAWTAICILATLLAQRVYSRRVRTLRLRALKRAAETGEIAVTIGIGGAGKPQDDVVAYLAKHQPNIKHLLVYQAPSDGTLGQPDTAIRILEDLRDEVLEIGATRIVRVHFFPAGIIGYPFLLGAMLRNLCPVVVYHKSDGGYAPLYQWDSSTANAGARVSQPLAPWLTVDIGAGPPTSAAGAPGKVI